MLSKRVCKQCINQNRHVVSLLGAKRQNRPWQQSDENMWDMKCFDGVAHKVMCHHPDGNEFCAVFANVNEPPPDYCKFAVEHLLDTQK